MQKEQVTLENKRKLGSGWSPTDSINISNHNYNKEKPIQENVDESSESDPETKELDEYLERRLERIQAQKALRDVRRNSGKIPSIHNKSKSKQKLVIHEDSEYEYILESEEEEEDWLSESSGTITPADKIFTNSFMKENNPKDIRKNEISKRSSNPFEWVLSTNQNKDGRVTHAHARTSKINNDGSCLETKVESFAFSKILDFGEEDEERKEDSYLNPSIDSSNGFSNISAIIGQQNFNRASMLSFQEPSMADEDYEFDNEFKDLYDSQTQDNNDKNIPKISLLESSDGESQDMKMQNNVKILKNDMGKITKDLEKIRDLIMTAPDAQNLLKDIKQANHEEIGEAESEGDSEYDLPEYNSREISDIITSHKM